MRRLFAAAIMAGLASHALASPPAAQDRLERLRAEAREASQRADRLEARADQARNDVARIAARRAALAGRIDALDTRLAAARIEEERLLDAIDDTRAQIALAQEPASALLAGLATLSRRPPLLTLADGGSLDEFVRTQLLVEAVVPAIDARTRAVRDRAATLAALAEELATVRTEIESEQTRLATLRTDLADAERSAGTEAADLDRAAARAGTRALAAGERGAELVDEATREAFTAEIAASLATYDSAPPPPRSLRIAAGGPPLAYRLPVDGRITAGLGSLDADGVRARGLTIAARRGAPVTAPAAGTIRFVGAFRGRDGIVILDHGDGWHSLLAGVATTARRGQRVARGERLGTARGTMLIELWDGRTPRSPALIAGSS
ncbi:peptidoglycan DD-metalloendopeptidase family protein [Sphingomicrobium sp. XHP0239]|uniref:murein hydrolase activator EnvC family protein n=1 Tax=Sphingomicrobium maritimum TaxID=3133972 RepID=UPI0031CCC5B2